MLHLNPTLVQASGSDAAKPQPSFLMWKRVFRNLPWRDFFDSKPYFLEDSYADLNGPCNGLRALPSADAPGAVYYAGGSNACGLCPGTACAPAAARFHHRTPTRRHY